MSASPTTSVQREPGALCVLADEVATDEAHGTSRSDAEAGGKAACGGEDLPDAAA
jgi:hypothetical protein